jgi:multiple sugar transport system permease protein
MGPYFFLFAWLIPEMTLIIPYYMIERSLRLLDTHFGLIIAYVSFSLPFTIWMIRGFIEEFPIDIEEAAIVDGCSRTMVILRIVFPNIAPGVVGTGIYIMLHCWNEFPFALVLTRFNAKTMPVMILASGIGEIGVHWGTITAFGIVAVLPMIIFTIIFQRYFVKGITQGAVKR